LPTLYVFSPSDGAFSAHALSPDAQMPYVRRFPFPVSDFLGGRNTDVCWTDRRALLALDELHLLFGRPFSVGRAFLRVGAQTCSERSQHHTGAAFDIGGALRASEREELRLLALDNRLFAYAEPAFLSGNVAHLSLFSCYPQRLRFGETGVFAFVLQDALLRAGVYRGALTGTVCGETLRAARRLEMPYPVRDTIGRGVLLAALSAARN